MDDLPEPFFKVLVIDDSEMSQRLIERILRTESLHVIVARDGLEGLVQARRSRPDLILLDIELPVWDGFRTFQELEDDLLTRPIPVIFFSSLDSPTAKARGLDMGAVDFITKSSDPEELRARVRAALRAKTSRDLLERRAHLDGLTGLGNRHAMSERLQADWELAQKRHTPLSVLLADIDRFKSVNDRLGHDEGDRLLRAMAKALQDSVRAGDFLARFGGDEFIAVAHDCPLVGALAMGERLRDAMTAISARGMFAGQAISVSVGVATSEPDDLSPETIVRRADSALYHAKTSGRNAVWACEAGQFRPAWPDPRFEIALA